MNAENLLEWGITLNNARLLAERAHLGQFRRDGRTCYIEHPLDVRRRVDGDPPAEATALLHDTMESDAAEVLPEEVLRTNSIPEDVIEAVKLLTHAQGETYRAYLLRVRENALAKKVKIADILANLSDTPTERQIVKYAKGLLTLMDKEEAPPALAVVRDPTDKQVYVVEEFKNFDGTSIRPGMRINLGHDGSILARTKYES